MSDDVQDTKGEEAGGAPAGDASGAEASSAEASSAEASGAGVATAVEDAPAETEAETETEEQPPAEGDEEHAPAALEAGPAVPDPVRDRLLLPLLLPLGAMVAVFLFVVNISRVFLASGNEASVIVGTIVTVGILAGGAAISATPRLRSSTLVMMLAGLMIIVMSAGLLSLGPSEETEEAGAAGYQQPDGPPVATLEVQALPSNTFQASEFTVPAGIIQVNYVDVGGTHTLVFSNPEFTGFQLAVPGGPISGKVELAPGNYTIYCTIPGHRAAGMQANVTVTPAGEGATPPAAGGAPPAEGGAPPGGGPASSTPSGS
jgi:plastocyanin